MRKIVFCGFGKLGKGCLERLIDEGYEIILILTHKELTNESVDTFAKNNNLVYTYEDLRKNIFDIRNFIEAEGPYFLISVNYRYIIPKDIFELPKYAINVHGSLLPKYRGRTPHVWSIINGEEYSGITAHIIEETVDTGDIINQLVVKIEREDTGYSLLRKFEKSYPKLLIDSLLKLEKGIPLVKQNETYASYYGKRTPDMGYIDFYKNANEVINFIRAQARPYPGAYYYLKTGLKIIINKVMITTSTPNNFQEGVIEQINESYFVKCKDATLKLIDYEIVN